MGFNKNNYSLFCTTNNSSISNVEIRVKIFVIFVIFLNNIFNLKFSQLISTVENCNLHPLLD